MPQRMAGKPAGYLYNQLTHSTPFGTVFASNLTPDAESGLGRWSAEAFWRAMHHGQSRDGRLLVPASPCDSYTQISRADSDALYAFLGSLPAVSQANRPHAAE